MNQEQTPDQAHQIGAAGGTSPEQAGFQMRQAEFTPLTGSGPRSSHGSINRFLDVRVTISAELGRVSMAIGELMELGEGSVVELDRPLTSPIDLMAQGVRVATGEVVVIDDNFAVRIKSIDSAESQDQQE